MQTKSKREELSDRAIALLDILEICHKAGIGSYEDIPNAYDNLPETERILLGQIFVEETFFGKQG